MYTIQLLLEPNARDGGSTILYATCIYNDDVKMQEDEWSYYPGFTKTWQEFNLVLNLEPGF